MNSFCPKNQFMANSSSGCLCPDPPKGLAPTSWLKATSSSITLSWAWASLPACTSSWTVLPTPRHGQVSHSWISLRSTLWIPLPLSEATNGKDSALPTPPPPPPGSRPSRTWVPRRVDACLEGFASLYFFQCSQSSVYRVFVCEAESSRSDPRLKNLTMNVSLNRSSARGIIDWSVCYVKCARTRTPNPPARSGFQSHPAPERTDKGLIKAPVLGS